jgi:flagellar biosynthetic protein FliP
MYSCCSFKDMHNKQSAAVSWPRVVRVAAKLSLALLATGALGSTQVYAQQAGLPDLSISIGGSEMASSGSVASSLKILLLLTALSFAPAMILCMTCFTRIAVVLGMTRTALGTASLPPNTVITGLALFLTVAIMGPIAEKSYVDGIRPYMEGQMGQEEAMKKAGAPLKQFLVRHAREKDLALFLQITRSELPKDPQDVPFFVAVPGFILSELNTAFQIGFLIALPFLVLDMVVSSVLTSMSMITLPPVVISLPLKLMLFVLVDGWHLIISSLVKTYRV